MGDDEPDHADIIEDLEVRLENPEDECKCGSESCQQLKLSQELDIILDPSITYRSPCQLERIWPLLTNRAMEVSSFLALLGEYQAERHCGIAWLQDFVAYRCRTCSDSPNMAICPDCFKNSDHQGHDYNMFKSGSGGACDCGYEIVKESGHCSRHGRNATAKRANETIPESLICVPRRMIPRLIHRLAIQLRKSSADIDIYLDCLTQLANSCSVLRNLMIEALISREVYSSQIHVLSNQVGNKQSSKIFKDGLKYLEHEQKCLRPFNIPREWRPPTKEINAFCDNLAISCFVDELVFWLIVYELPEKLVCFLLGLLMDEQYRRIFARSFVRNYPRILLTLIGIRVNRHLTRESYDKLSRRISHLSVQLYCHPNLTRELCDEEYVLHTIIYCLRAAIEGTSSDSGVLEPNRLCPPTRQMPMVVNTEAPLIRDRHLRSFTSDLYNILACKSEVLRLLNDSNLLNTWLEMLSNFQTMYPHKRELNEHTPYENGPHMSVFAVEADFCHSTMWSLLSCLKEKTTINSSRSLLSALHTNLARWFYIMNIGPNSKLDPYHMSFHIPLHRMFASTLRNMMFIQKVSDQDLHKFISCNQALLGTQYSYRSASGIKTPIPFSGFVQMLLLHPLQALTLYNEIRNNMWTRNGISIINQAITYVHCACSFSTVDLDMFLLKYSASKLNPNYFIRTLMTRFHAWKWLSFKSNILMSDSTEEVRQLYHFNILPEQVILMIESSLVTLIQLLTLSIYCNVSEKEQTRQEMVALISVIDRSYSYLLDMLPDRGVTNFGSADQNFVALLDELTIYKPAQHGPSGNLQQGSYTLKPSVWDLEYNPIQVLYRFYQKRDYQMSLERYFQHAKLTGKLDRRYHPSTLWPPLKIPRNLGVVLPHLNLNPLFECQALVGLVFTIIHKNLYYADVPDSIMAYTIHLLELSLRTCLASDIKSNQKPIIDSSFNGRYSMKELSSCPAYFGSRDESNIKGNTIFSVPDAGSGETDDDRLFPVVKNALDLAFETTWFPFSSVLENCLVHIENVHLLPPREFEALLESQQDLESKPDGATHTGKVARAGGGTEQAQSSDAEMYWSEQEYDESGIEEMIDDIDPDEDEEEEDEDDDDDDDDDVADDEDDLGGPGENIADDGPLRDFELEIRDFVRARPITHERGDIIFRLRSSNSDSRGESNTIGLVGGEQQNRSTAANQQQTTGVRSSMESPLIVTESLPEFQSSALSLIPVRGHDIGHDGSTSNATNIGNNNSSGSTQLQIYPENLMTQRRALEAPEAVPMLEDSPQPLALEGPRERASEPAGASSGPTAQSLQVGGVNSNRREERSLSEMDIHARFVGFFQPRQESLSRSHLRGLRPRQTARRGGYRGPAPMTPLAVHNPAGSNISHAAAVAAAPPPPPAYVMHPVDHGAGADGNNNNNNNSTANENEALQPPSVGDRGRSRGDDGGGGGGGGGGSGQQHSALRPATTTMAPTSAARGTTDPRPRRATQCSCALLNRALSARLHPDLHQRRLRRDRMHHGESLLSLLLRLHAKYSNRANSYEYNERRAEANLSPDRTRVGDGVHFVAIVLDLICHSNQRMLARVGQLQRLIWASSNETATGGGVGGRSDATAAGASCETTKMQLAGAEEEEEGAHTHRHRHRLRQAGGGSQSGEEGGQLGGSSGAGASAKPAEGYLAGSGGGGNCGVGAEANQGSESGSSKVIPSASLDPSERRRRAKEFQGKLMAEFASRQRAFMEKYESSSSRADDGSGAPGSGVGACGKSDKIDLEPDEEPINLSSKLSSETRPQMSEQDKQQQQRQRIASTSEAAAAAGSVGSVGATKARRKQELTPADNSAHSSRFASANDQRAGGSTSGGCRGGGNKASAEQEEPTYECCICGSDSSSTDLTNPLGQVVLLQATSVYGHAHLRPRHERTLPCDDVEQLELQEETYAKYLGRRIDLMCEYFCESSRLDTINIGAEGGVHVQSCGHYLHIECHQSYIKSLDQEDRPHARQYTDGFLCPVCRQLANSVLPMLGARRQSSSSVFSSSSSSGHHVHPSTQLSAATKSHCEPSSSSTSTATDQSDDDPCACGDTGGVVALTLEQQIKLIGSLLEHRSQPNQRELQSSASFCQHLTKATEYRRVKSEPNMHSLFLFLTSIARTNLETEVIMRSTRYGRATSNSGISSGRAGCMTPEVGGGAASRSASTTTTTTTPSTKTPPMTTTTTMDGAENGAPGRQRSCFLLLFQVLALNSRTLIEDHWFTYDQLWAHLTHQADEKNRLSVKPTKRSEVPLLLRDPTAMLLQFLFAITDPKHLSYQATHFTCLVQMLFNLTVIQSIALVLSYIRPQDKARLGLLNSQQQQPPHQQQQQQQQPRAQPESQQQTSCLFASSALQATEAGEPSYGLRHVGAFESSPLSANSSSSYDTQAIQFARQASSLETSPRKEATSAAAAASSSSNQFSYLLASVLSGLSSLLLPTNEEPLLDQRVRARWSNELLMDGLSLEAALALAENRTKLACLPFLRAAALIRHHLYGQPLPDLAESLDDRLLCEPAAIEADFAKLASYLQLVGTHSAPPAAATTAPQATTTTATTTTATELVVSRRRLVDALNWPPGAQESLVSSWSAELLRFGAEFSMAARSLLVCRPLAWHRPSLMKLPDSFDDIFLFYYRKECSLCHQVPKDVAVCLVCGAPVCFRNGCCKARSGSRQLHSHHCGAGTAIFLAIQTSSIVVIRGSRACVWGSVYLDAHDEEDSGLQRGKPLHLVQARYRLLEDQWLRHTFDHTCGKRWIYLQEN